MSARRFSLSRLARSLFPRSKSPGRKLAARRAFLEQLERRDLLAQVSANAYDIGGGEVDGLGSPSFRISRAAAESTPLTVNFSISSSATGKDGVATEGVDFEEIDPKSVTIPANEVEAFVLIDPKDDNKYEGTESITLTITPDASYTIGTAEASVYIGDDEILPGFIYAMMNSFTCRCPCTCPPQQVSTSGNPASGDAAAESSGAVAHHSSNAASGKVSVAVNGEFTDQVSEATDIEVKAKINGGSTTTRHYSGSSFDAGEDYQLMVQMDAASSGATHDGYYKAELEVKEYYPASPDIIRNASGPVKVVTYAGGEFGKGWQPMLVDRLHIQSSSFDYEGALWIRGDFSSFWFAKIDGNYQREAGEPDFSTLTQDGTDYVLRKKDGEVLRFESAGGNLYMLATRTDRAGNETTYTYADKDADGNADEIVSITAPGGLTTSFTYDPLNNPTKVTSITDPYGRVTDLEYTSGSISKIKEPDPDGAGPLTRPETTLTHSGNKISSYTDPEGNTTSFGYVDNLLRTITHPGGGVETFEVQFGRALAGAIKTADVKTIYTNEVNATWTITFNEFGNALKVVDPYGKVTDYTINNENLVTQRTDPDPDDGGPQTRPQTNYTYDAKRNITRIDYPDGSHDVWTYDTDFSQVTDHTDRAGRRTVFTVDSANGNTAQMTQWPTGGANMATWNYTYTTTNVKGLLASIEDPEGYDTTITRNSHGLVTSVVYEVGPGDTVTEEFGYDSADNLAWAEDGLDRRTDYVWDTLDRLLSMTLPDPDGVGALVRPVYTFEYNKNNYVKKETDPLGRITEYVYNSRDDVVQIKQPDPDGAGPAGVPTTTIAYDLHRRTTSITDPLSHVTSFGWDLLDRQTSLTLPDPDGAGALTAPVYVYAYDNLGRTISVTDPDRDGAGPLTAQATLYDHATWNEITATLPDPDGAGPAGTSTVEWVFNAEGDLTGYTDELGRTQGYTYDPMGRLITYSPAGGISWQFGYNRASHQTSVTNPRGFATTYAVDGLGRVTQETQPDPDAGGPLAAPVSSFTYNDASELVTATDPRSYVASYTYDGIGRLKTITEPDPDGGGSQTSPVTTFHYDAVSNLTGVLDPLGNFTDYFYDDLDRLIEVLEPDPDGGGSQLPPQTSYAYDLVGNLLSVTDPLARVTSYEYDNLDRLKKITQPDPDGGGSQTAPITQYTYDAVNSLLTVTDALNNVTSFGYDNRYRHVTTTQPDPDGAGPLTSPVWTYTLDAAGQVTEALDPLNRDTDYTYDGLGRITRVTEADPDGGGSQTRPETDYAYDASSNVTSVTDPLENVVSYVYDNLDRLQTVTRPDPDGGGSQTSPVTTYAYDASGNLISVTDPLARVTAYAYDGLDRRTTVTQPDPDSGGPLTSPVTSFAYDAVGNVTGITDPRGNTTSRTLDNLYRQIAVTQADPDGGGSQTSPVTSFAYDAASQLVSVTDPLSRLTSYEYDGLGRNTKITEPDPDGAGGAARPFSTMSYDAVGNLLSVTDPLSHTTSYLYDNLYRQTRITDANSGQTNFTYDKVGNLLTLDDPVGNMTTWVYDGLDRAIEEENELGHSRLFTFDLVGNLKQKTDRNGRVTQYAYDNLHRNTTETWIDVPAPEPQLNISTTTQGTISDEVQRVGISVMGPGFTGGTFTLTYDGQTTAAIAYNATAATVQAELEALSNIAPGDVVVTKVSDTSTSQVWQITFAGNLADTNVSQTTIDSTNVTVMYMKSNVQTTDTAGGAITYEVQTTSLLNANGGTYTLSFQDQTTDPLAWNASAATIDTALEGLSTIDTVDVSGSSGCFSITFTGTHSGENVPQLAGDDSLLENHQNRVLSFEYDAADQLTAAEDPAAEYAYVYDNLGRVTQQTQTIAGLTPSIVFNQAFDATSNRTELSATIGGTADFKNTYAYDNLNRMTQVIQQANGGNAVAEKRVDFAYNASGQFDTISRYQSTGTTAPVATSHFAYDGMGRLSSLDHKTNGGATTLAGYDYTYDAASRITSIDSTVEGLSTFTYDVTNQLTAADHTSQPDENYSFDLNGNRTMTGHTVIANNRLSTDGTYNYEYDNEGNQTKRTKISDGSYEENTWDHRNRLTKVTFKDASHTVTKTVEYAYDVFTRLVRRTADADGPGGAAAVDQFFAFDGYEPVLQFDGTSASDLSNRDLFGPAVDQILAVEDVTSLSSAGNVLWGLSDHLGTPRDVADRNEGTGVTTVTNHRTFNSFGTQISESNAAVDFIFGETGKILDDLTGANIHLFRWLRGGQWLSEDRSGFAAGDANLRRYVHNNAANLIDPEGLDEKKPPLTGLQKFGRFLVGLSGPGIPVSEADEAIKDAISVDTLIGLVLGPSIPLDQPERALDLLGPSTRVEDLGKEEASGELYEKFGRGIHDCVIDKTPGPPTPGRKIKVSTGTKVGPFDGSVGMRSKKGVPNGTSGKQGKPVDRLKEQPKRSAPVVDKPKDTTPPERDTPADPTPELPTPDEPAKKVPNPHGSVGKPDHQDAADDLVKDFERRHPDAEIRGNKSIEKETGLNVRPDAAAVKDGDVLEVGEVARTNKDGTLVCREQKKQKKYDAAGLPSTVVKLPPKK